MFTFIRNLFRPSLKKIIAEAEREVDFTPDVWDIEQKEFHHLFEYGEAKRDERRYDIISEFSVYQGVAFTQESHFGMWVHDIGPASYPIMLETRRKKVTAPVRMLALGNGSARIRGEWHLIQPEGLIELDKYRLNGIQFLRKPVSIDFPHRKIIDITDQNDGSVTRKTTGEQHYKKIKAYAYFGIKEYWDTRLDAGFDYPTATYNVPTGPKSIPFYDFKSKS